MRKMVQTRAWKGWWLAEGPFGSGAPSLLSSLCFLLASMFLFSVLGVAISFLLIFPFHSCEVRLMAGPVVRTCEMCPDSPPRSTARLSSGRRKQPPSGALPPVLLLHHPVWLRAFASAQEWKLRVPLCYSWCLKVCPRPSGSAPFCLPRHTSCQRGTLASHHH